MRSLLKQLVARLLLSLSGIASGLLIMELLLRLIGIAKSPQGIFFEPDPYTGWVNRPGAAGHWDYEGDAEVKINKQGLRDREHIIDKPKHTIRIAVLGDSFMAAFQVDQSKDFSSVTERSLRGCSALNGRDPEVINFGVNAYGTGQELITLERRARRYSPDIVILAFYENDLYDNSLPLKQEYPQFTLGPRPYFYFQNCSMVLDNSFRVSKRFLDAVRKSADESSAYGVGIHRLLWKSRCWQILSRVRPSFRLRSPMTEPFTGTALSAPITPEWQEAWKITERLISKAHQESEELNARFLLVLVPHALQVYPGAVERTASLRSWGVLDPFYLNRRMAALAQREGFKILSLAQPMQKYADERHTFFYGFSNTVMGQGHWNETGQQLAGELTASKLCDMLGDK